MKTSFSALLFVALCACGRVPQVASVPANGGEGVRTVAEAIITEGDPVTKADLSINGMTCAMMCGGAIKDALAKLPGVKGTEIIFNEGDVVDHAVVTYDGAAISDAEMVKAIEGLHEGQYKVTAIAVTKQVKQAATNGPSDAPATTAEQTQVNASALPEMVLPSLLGLLSRLLRI